MPASARKHVDEENGVPLVSRGTNGTTTNPNSNIKTHPPPPSSFRERAILAFAAASLVAFLLIFKTDAGATAADVVKKTISVTASGGGGSSSKVCDSLCSVRTEQRNDHYHGDLLNNTQVLQLVTNARDAMMSKLQEDYGKEYYDKMFVFNKKSRGRMALHGPDEDSSSGSTLSRDRFKRKLTMKILKMQTAILEQESNVEGCDCTPSFEEEAETDETKLRHRRRRRLQDDDESSTQQPSFPDTYSNFVWVTGGHSAAAGHGNLHNESMTAYMERTVQGVFASVGIAFTGRNYAMGGTPSGPELALCQEAIFGKDADVLTWDFGMMEATEYWRKYFYANRAGLIPGRPTIVDIHLEGRMQKGRVEQLAKVEKNGLSALYVDPAHTDAMRAALPDMFGMNTEEIAALPELVKYHKCQGQYEKGDPFCGEYKYSQFHCPQRGGRAGWHPGWKEHAMFGNIMALFLADTLLDVATELSKSTENPTGLLAKLQAEEDKDYEKFFDSVIPEPLEDISDEFKEEVNATILFRSPSVCHTARLPAEARYLGYVTETDKVGREDFDIGTSRQQAEIIDPKLNDIGPMPLIFNEDEREQCGGVTLKIDFKDYFFNRQGFGWRSLTFPNEAERKAYVRDGWQPKGLIMICFANCAWGKCASGEFRWEEMYVGKLKMKVNGAEVVNVTEWAADCVFLRGKDGHFFKANRKGQYELKTLVQGNATDPDSSYTKISSVVIV